MGDTSFMLYQHNNNNINTFPYRTITTASLRDTKLLHPLPSHGFSHSLLQNLQHNNIFGQ